MRIALLGMHELTMRGFDPRDWDEVFGLAHDLETPIRCTHAFEAHSREIVEAHNSAHVDRLRSLAEIMPLWTAWDWPRLGPSHRVVPYTSLTYGSRIESSIAYLMAAAIDCDPDAIGIYGVDMAEGEEYGYQRPNMAYLIGVAEALGINVELHEASRLLRSEWTGGCYGHPANVGDMDYKLGPQAPVQDGEVEATA